MNILFQMFLNLKVIKQSLCFYRTCNSCACSGSSHFEVLRHIGNILEKISIYLSCLPPLSTEVSGAPWKRGGGYSGQRKKMTGNCFPFSFCFKARFLQRGEEAVSCQLTRQLTLAPTIEDISLQTSAERPLLYLPSLSVTVVSSIDDTPWLPCLKEFPFTLAPQLYKVAGPG